MVVSSAGNGGQIGQISKVASPPSHVNNEHSLMIIPYFALILEITPCKMVIMMDSP